MTDRELMQEALYALTYVGDAKEIYSDTIESLRARLAQPNEFEPDWDAMAVMVEEQQRMAKRIEELETALAQPEQKHSEQWWRHEVSNAWAQGYEQGRLQREWKGLADEEIRGFEIWLDDEEEKHGWNPPADIVKYIEAKLKEKNT